MLSCCSTVCHQCFFISRTNSSRNGSSASPGACGSSAICTALTPFPAAPALFSCEQRVEADLKVLKSFLVLEGRSRSGGGQRCGRISPLAVLCASSWHGVWLGPGDKRCHCHVSPPFSCCCTERGGRGWTAAKLAAPGLCSYTKAGTLSRSCPDQLVSSELAAHGELRSRCTSVAWPKLGGRVPLAPCLAPLLSLCLSVLSVWLSSALSQGDGYYWVERQLMLYYVCVFGVAV